VAFGDDDCEVSPSSVSSHESLSSCSSSGCCTGASSVADPTALGFGAVEVLRVMPASAASGTSGETLPGGLTGEAAGTLDPGVAVESNAPDAGPADLVSGKAGCSVLLAWLVPSEGTDITCPGYAAAVTVAGCQVLWGVVGCEGSELCSSCSPAAWSEGCGPSPACTCAYAVQLSRWMLIMRESCEQSRLATLALQAWQAMS
jgi:hypothetical protein